MRMMRTLGCLFVFLAFLLGSRPASGQDDQLFETGQNPYRSYQNGNIDSINLFSRGLNVDIPLISYPQRGGKLGLNFVLHYLNLGSWYDYSCPSSGCYYSCSSIWPLSGFSVIQAGTLSSSQESCVGTGDQYNSIECSASVSMADGGGSSLLPTSVKNWESYDTGGIRLSNATPQFSGFGGYFTDRNGISYPDGVVTPPPPGSYLPIDTYNTIGQPPYELEDTNGNEITYQPYGSGVNPGIGWTDTMNRNIPLPVSESVSSSGCPTAPLTPVAAYVWNFPGVNEVTYSVTFCYANVHYAVDYGAGYSNGNMYQLQSVLLPNGTSWTFQYSSDGNADLTQITFPTGGTLSYTWTPTQTLSDPCVVHSYTNARGVVTRTLNANNSDSSSGVWKYSGISEFQALVTDPLSNDTVHTFTDLTQNACPYYETTTQYYQGSHTTGTLLKTLKTAYTTLGINNTIGQPTTVNVLWPNSTNQENQTTIGYDNSVKFYSPIYNTQGTAFQYNYPPTTSSYGLALTKQEYDYGSGAHGALLRTTTTNYQALSNSNYLTNNLLDLPASAVVTGSGPGATTTYGYDQSTPVSSGITTMHTSSPLAGSYRGNPTTISHYLNTTGTYLSTTSTFWDTGMVDVVKDPKNNPQATYAYSSTYVGAYPTTITNALGQTNTYTYDLNSGLVTSVKDPNNQTTTFTYDPKNWRNTEIVYPDTGQTNICYSDTTGEGCTSGPPYEVIVTKKINSSQSAKETTVLDGLGRVSQTQVNSTSSPTYTDIFYDAEGRILKEYNPTFCNPPTTNCGEATWGYTTYAYDALNRTTLVTNPDNSTDQYVYTGRATEVTDEGNGTKSVQKISQTDALGRLSSVCEVSSTTLSFGTSSTPGACGQDIGGTGFLTSYSYDTLNNLLSVSQGSLSQRTFIYDSLSRLTSATNPESATTTYGYDADSNVISKVSPKPNQTSPSVTVTTTYQYDALNRLTQKSYSDGVTPTANVVYDTAGLWNIPQTNPIGRMTEAYLTSNTYLVGSIFGYDPLGRVAMNNQCPYGKTCPAGGYPVNYTYDLLGDMTSYTNGESVTLTYGYNSAAQLTSLTSNLSDANHPSSLLSSALYNAPGSLTSASMGTITTTSGIGESHTYNNRLRPIVIGTGVNTSSGYVGLEGMTYGYAPNGDVTSLADGPTGNWTFKYDDFNRLISTVVPDYSTSPYAYSYDRYGNRWQQTANGSCSAGTASCISFDANNHVTGGILTYDAAGNVTADNMHHYTYDAENRLTQVDAGTTASYVYDSFGQRAQRTTAVGSFALLYDLTGHAITEINSSGVWDRGEVYLPNGRHLVTYNDGLTYFSSVDALGSERVRSTQNESSYESCTSLPFGDDQYCSGSAAGTVSPLHFTGQERDTETNLDNFKARYLASSLGRFMSPDPGNAGAFPNFPQSWNAYSYVLNNPLDLTDPTGLSCVNLTGDAGCTEDFSMNLDSHIPMPPSGTGDDCETNPTLRGCPSGPDRKPAMGCVLDEDACWGIGWGPVPKPPENRPRPSRQGSHDSVWMTGFDPFVVGSMRSAVVGSLKQAVDLTVCGGGFFGYYGKGGEALGFKGFRGVIGEYDTRSGGSFGTLSEGGFLFSGWGLINATNGKHGLTYLELGEIPGAADAGVVSFGNGGGGYLEEEVLGGEFGGGAYLNIVPKVTCKE
jgi:RHS repeat-associated protein